MHKVLYASYLADGHWKCAKSPTGAHNWVVATPSMVCKYCAEIRQTRPERAGDPIRISSTPTTAIPLLDLDDETILSN